MLMEYFTTDEDCHRFSVLWDEDGKAMLCYLADIFSKLNTLNLALQGSNKTLVDAKISICGFVTRLELLHLEVNRRNFRLFQRLANCTISDEVLLVISDHIKKLIGDFQMRFSDLTDLAIPDWLTQPFISDISTVEEPTLQEELTNLIHDASAKVIHKSKGQLMWLSEEIFCKYPLSSQQGRLLLLPFPSSYLVECGFSSVVDILTKKRNCLDICKRGDLRLKLTKLEPNIISLANSHQPQGSH